MSVIEQSVKVSVNDLDADHLAPFNRTLKNILSTTLAEQTFAQIIDGMPTVDDVNFFPTYSWRIRENTSSSLEAMEAARGLREKLDTYSTSINAKLAQDYQNAPVGSRDFYMRLLEVLAVACHDIAAFVFATNQPGLRFAEQSAEDRLAYLGRRPTDLMHEDYRDFQQYPNGIPDVVGYWAEYHLFGGVVLFDRGESGTDCKNAFLHPVGKFKIFQISDAQIQKFSDYVDRISECADITEMPLPFRAEKWTYRADPYDAMSLNIYRNKYERIIPKERPRRCVTRLEDDPGLQDIIAKYNPEDPSQ